MLVATRQIIIRLGILLGDCQAPIYLLDVVSALEGMGGVLGRRTTHSLWGRFKY